MRRILRSQKFFSLFLTLALIPLNSEKVYFFGKRRNRRQGDTAAFACRELSAEFRSLAHNAKKNPFGIYLSILLGKLRKSLLFRKEAKPTKSKRRPLAVFLQKSCFADMVRRNFVHFAYSVRLPMQKKIPIGILFLHLVRRQGFEPGTH